MLNLINKSAQLFYLKVSISYLNNKITNYDNVLTICSNNNLFLLKYILSSVMDISLITKCNYKLTKEKRKRILKLLFVDDSFKCALSSILGVCLSLKDHLIL